MRAKTKAGTLSSVICLVSKASWIDNKGERKHPSDPYRDHPPGRLYILFLLHSLLHFKVWKARACPPEGGRYDTRAGVAELGRRARKEKVTLVFGARDAERSNAAVIAELMKANL